MTNLDRRVAECLGWKWIECKDLKLKSRIFFVSPKIEWQVWEIEPRLIERPDYSCSYDSVPELPKYSTCPDDCDIVKREIQKRGWCYYVQYYPQAKVNKFASWIQKCTGDEDPNYCTKMLARKESDSEYEAVCLAFVAACGREIK